jgi:predicted GNAT family N-acyltransferase
MQKCSIKQIKFLSKEYDQMVTLRRKVLRIPLGLDFTKEELNKDKDDFLIGAFLESDIIGCLILTPQSQQKVKMRQVAIDTVWQGSGIGQQIVQYAESFSIAKHFNYMHCNARATAVSFYKKQGYTISGNEFKEVGIAHYYMSKNLNPISLF